jgi:hypothetical protein
MDVDALLFAAAPLELVVAELVELPVTLAAPPAI